MDLHCEARRSECALHGLLTLATLAQIEGLMTVVVACIAPFLIQDFPEESKFLSPKEKEFVLYRLKQDTGAAGNFRWAYAKRAFLDWKTYASTSAHDPDMLASQKTLD